MQILWVDDNADLFPGIRIALRARASKHDFELDIKTALTFDDAAKILNDSSHLINLVLFDFTLSRSGPEMISGRRRGLDLVNIAVRKGIRHFVAFSVLSRDEMAIAWTNNCLLLHETERVDLKFESLQKEVSSNDVAATVFKVQGLP